MQYCCLDFNTNNASIARKSMCCTSYFNTHLSFHHNYSYNVLNYFDWCQAFIIIWYFVLRLSQYVLFNDRIAAELDRSSNQYFFMHARFSRTLSRKTHRANQMEDTSFQACKWTLDRESLYGRTRLQWTLLYQHRYGCSWLYNLHYNHHVCLCSVRQLV